MLRCTKLVQTITHLKHVIVERHLGHVLGVFAFFAAGDLHEKVVPLSVIHPDLRKLQQRHTLLPQQHLHLHLTVHHLQENRQRNLRAEGGEVITKVISFFFLTHIAPMQLL